MATDFKQARSGISSENIQEVLDASASAKLATQGGQQQYLTPDWLARKCHKVLQDHEGSEPLTILDPQCGKANLLTSAGSWRTKRFGIEIDNRITDIYGVELLTGNCVKVQDIISDLYPELHFDCGVGNPPFGVHLAMPDGTKRDSTVWTWEFLTQISNRGFFIANHKTITRLGYDKHPHTFKYETLKGNDIWKGMNEELEIGIVYWSKPAAERKDAMDGYEIPSIWREIATVLDEEKKKIPPWNIWLGKDGKLCTYLSTRAKTKKKLTRDQVLMLTRIDGSHPLTLTTERETRKLMRELVDCGFYTIEEAALAGIESALAEVDSLACPIMPVTDFETVAYADEEDSLLCIKDTVIKGMRFTAGKRYDLTTRTFTFTECFKRKKVHFDEKSSMMYTADHDCALSGQDRCIELDDDDGNTHRFMDKPTKGQDWEHEESMLWEIFQRPVVRTLSDTHAKIIAQTIERMRDIEFFGEFQYYPGQVEYVARMGCKDYGLVAGAVGTGKTLMALSLIQLKAPKRALIIAPQGTLRSSEDDDEEEEETMTASQWVQEIRRFAPGLPVFELFSMEDYEKIRLANGGTLPFGVFITYYQAFFSNKSRESAPSTWDDIRLADECAKIMQSTQAKMLSVFDHDLSVCKDLICKQIGQEHNGIRCIVTPSMSTLIGDQFDGVFVDEIHIACNPTAGVTQKLIRLQPKYRFGFTATPIPNMVTQLFSMIGWLAVPNWFRGGMRNAAWPYAREEGERFADTFLSKERDHTEESFKRAADPRWRGKVEKPSPVISSPARLLKMLKPTMAYISKPQCNPDYKPGRVIDVRVPMGQQQAKLYGHFLNRGNIAAKNPLVRARKQIAYLRNICADPAGFTHGGPSVRSNMNPKTWAIINLAYELIAKGEQVVIVSARKGQTNTIAELLRQAGIVVARIDSTVPASEHSYQANLFKMKKAQVQLMGIKCAMGYSFPECPNLIIGSLEYSFGPFEQAKGRVDRVNSRYPAVIYCVLHSGSIEETMYDNVATKEDAATICLHGRRIPRDFKPVDASEIMATALTSFSSVKTQNEDDIAAGWPKLRELFRSIKRTASVSIAA